VSWAPSSSTPTLDGAGPGVKEAGQAALDSGSTDRMREFLTTGHFTARTNDERVRAVQLMESGGPELSAAAEVALAGPPDVLHAFIQVGQYSALRADRLTATHVARVQGLIAGAARVAWTAQENAALAQKVAAEARKASEKAAEYAQQAKDSATQAGVYADQARDSAEAAEKSAAEAAASARTARAAEADAHAAARSAANSAARATASAAAAQGSAGAAWQAAGEARASANAAGKSAEEAQKAFTEAIVATAIKIWEEAEAKRKDEEFRKDKAEAQALEDALADLAAEEEGDWWDYVSGAGHLILDTAGLVPGFGEAFDLINCGWYGAEGDALNSSLSCAAAIPIVGWGATAGKWGKTGMAAAEAFAKSMRAEGKIPHIWTANPRRGLSNAQNAATHWGKHKAEFPELSSLSEYVELAHRYSALGRNAVKNGQAVPGYRIYQQNGGSVAVFDEARGAWSAFTPDGIPQTMYKPRPYDAATNPNGYRGTLEDWLREPGRGTELR
jgi:hypothetical protein